MCSLHVHCAVRGVDMQELPGLPFGHERMLCGVHPGVGLIEWVNTRVFICSVAEGSLEVKLPTTWTDETAEVGRVREEKRREKIREEKESEGRRCRCAKR